MSSLILLFVLLAPFCGHAEAGLNEFFDQANESMKSLTSVISAPAKIFGSLFGGPQGPLPQRYLKKVTAEVDDGSEVITIIKGPHSHTGVSQIIRQQHRPYETSAKAATDDILHDLSEFPPASPLPGPIADANRMPLAGLVNRKPSANPGGLLSWLPQWTV